MTFRTPGLRSGIGTGRSRLLLPVAAILAVVVVLFLVFTSIWTDLLWYRSIGFSSVYSTELWTRVLLFVSAGVLMGLVVGANMLIAYRLRPAYRPLSVEQQGLERYRTAVDPHRRLIAIAVVGALGLLTGTSAAGQWHIWLAFWNRTSFGTKDPQFHKDVSYFVFTYPFLRLLLGYIFATVILSIVVAVIVHYLYGGLRLQGPGDKASPPARAHLSVLVGVFVLLKAVAYWLDRYGLALSDRGVVTGPSYTDVNAVLPAKTILAVIAFICAVMFFVNIVRRGMMLPGVGFGLLVLSAVLVGGVYPLLIQQFQVRPNELDKESPSIARNIAATRTAYGVDKAQVTPYGAQTKPSEDQLRSEADTVSGVRLLDPLVVGPTFQQLQQVRNFYRFPDVLDIDRYQLEGASRDTVVAVREIEGAPEGRRGWVNDHLVYTHGYGFVGASGNKITERGEPDFVEKDVPPTGSLGNFEPRIYFGERSPVYSVVGAPAGAAPRELDYPDESPAGQQNNTYKGNGGVPIGSFFNRLLYSVKFQEKNLLLSGAINSESKILYDRTPRERVQRVAPWLTLDGDPYPAVVGGRVLWILDGYTTSAGYPYSEKMSLGDATRDTVTDTRSAVARQANDRVNYMRNSVKATVDAYDGTVRLYAWDDKDPVLRTWMKAFKGVVQPKSEISQQLMAHLRYPEDLFKVQRRILARYHVQQPGAFYSGQDFWEVPQDPTSRGKTTPPYYLSLRMPGDQSPKFSLTTAYSPRGRPNLAAFMSVDATPGSTYGQMRVLELPRNSPIQGPGQVQNTFEADANVKEVLNRLRLGGTQTVLGNLLTLPFGGGLLYVEPVYAQAAGGTEQEPYPILRQVLVMYGGDVGTGATLQEALNQIFKGGTGSVAPPPPESGSPATGQQASPEVQRAISDAQKAFTDGQEAMKKSDWTAYGQAQQRLKEALDRLARAQAAAARPAASASPSPSASPSATPAG
ncbi:UPF0182 family protein [Actinomadura alba]|uniref:UPF0182 protein HKK74_28720 n=1 Tax=Actinomadura alba TaxID=406431 RepID=A0ABR7LX62_9ACTN|nr:UPF0182 family protein [Actinomadura alba]MBC6469445.1 UPF0182 family protein [Actinomadura alba]